MSLHTELLKQSHFLARKEPKKPIQTSLRRSVSASCYALFHLLVDEATKLMLAGNVRGPLRDSLARAFHHAAMKQNAVAFTRSPIPPRLESGLDRQEVQQPLVDVATAFVQLQEARYDADYNRALRFTRREALDLADLAEQAFRDWGQIRGSLPADAFLTGLLVYRRMQG
ncbi:MAG: hypothetical protein OXD42_06685 [Rhodospirillaceae bacterium]|nr:hypothetical protein [Alphaproteobacteria bacterium]MCY4190992.1 hypothetical protein [Rhodospirillaceae bacterium]MCY4237051.1 hypothetical protein [Rhodospirillaceae bacterium]